MNENVHKGLSSQEASNRIKQFGYNEIPPKKVSVLAKDILSIILDPMGLMMLALSLIYWSLGKNSDATVLLVAYGPIVGIDVLLNLRSQKALNQLKQNWKTDCSVIRDGREKTIPSRQLVPGDLMRLAEGQTIPADSKVIEEFNLTVDESTLTGESVPIRKSTESEVYSGTVVLTGSGLVLIEKTGLQSSIGSIAHILSQTESTPSPLLRSIRKAIRWIFFLAAGLSLLVFLLGLWKTNNLIDSLIFSLTLGMAAIPEEFPMVFTLYSSLAAFRLMKRGILVKHLSGVEGLGRVDVICTDKTGTLTEGKFSLETIFPQPDSDEVRKALIFSCEPFAADAMESAIFEFIKSKKGDQPFQELHSNWTLKYDYPFDVKQKYMSHVWIHNQNSQHIIAMKGALEGVLDHCRDFNEKSIFTKFAETQAASGKRLLGLAMKTLTASGNREQDERGLTFMGILCFDDPVRPGVRTAVKECARLGIRIKMLTGDHLLTAHAVADNIGLPHHHDELFSGDELERQTLAEKQHTYQKGAIFARLRPEQKLELIESLRKSGNIVAMTGDGVNDAPALKLADVSISMGANATDIARSTAQIVLMKDDFGGIVRSISEGKRVLNALDRSFGYLIAFHIPIVGVAIFQGLMFTGAILLPIHIVLMELIVHPVSAFSFDEIFNGNPPKNIFNWKNRMWSVVRGTLLAISAIILFIWADGSIEMRRSLVVIILVLGNIGLVIGEKGGLTTVLSSGLTMRTWITLSILILLSISLIFFSPLTKMFSLTSFSTSEFLGLILFGFMIGFINKKEKLA